MLNRNKNKMLDYVAPKLTNEGVTHPPKRTEVASSDFFKVSKVVSTIEISGLDPNNRQLELSETVDIKKLYYIIVNNQEFNIGRSYVKGNLIDGKAQLTLLINYFNSLNHNELPVNYTQNNNIGRYYGNHPLQLQNLSRPIRHTVCRDRLIDLDFKNMHPTVLEWFCHTNNIDCQGLSYYNKNREQCLSDLQLSTEITKEEAKQDLLAIINGRAKYDSKVVKHPDWYIDFYNNIQIILNQIKILKPEFFKMAQNNKGKDGYNLEGTCINYLMQDLENTCLMIAYDTITRNNIRVASLVYDGLMIYRDDFEYERLHDILGQVEDTIYQKLPGLKLKFVEKEMDEGLDLEACGYSSDLQIPSKIANLNFDELPKFDNDSLAKDFSMRFNNKFIYQNTILYYFNGVYWQEDDECNVLKMFLANDYYKVLHDVNFNNWTTERMKLDPTQDEEKLALLDKAYQENSKSIYMLKGLSLRKVLIECIKGYITNQDVKFDSKPYLFCFKNRIWDLLLGKFVKPNPLDYITMTTEYKYNFDPDISVKCRELDKVIKQILPDEAVRNCNLKIIASGMCGKSLDKFVIWNGCGGNGKGILNKLIQACYGNYYKKASNSILIEKNKESSSANPEKANLDKKRYVVFVEPDKDIPFNCGTLKELTGEKQLNARHLYNTRKTTIDIHGTFIVECNQKPKLLEFDNAMERRIVDILYPSKFTDIDDELDDDNLVYKIDRDIDTTEWREKYRLAFFYYLQPYFKELYNDNFDVKLPQSVIERNLKYLSDSNDLFRWFKSLFDKDNAEGGGSYIEVVNEPTNSDFIRIKDIYDIFIGSIYYSNLTKKEKRDLSKNKFLGELTSIRQIRKFYKGRHQFRVDGKLVEHREVLWGLKLVKVYSTESLSEAGGFLSPEMMM